MTLNAALRGNQVSTAVLRAALARFLDKKQQLRVFHSDLHLDNIVLLQDQRIGMIDFDNARQLSTENERLVLYDFIPLVGSLILEKNLFYLYVLHYVAVRFGVKFDPHLFVHNPKGGFSYRTLTSYFRAKFDETAMKNLKLME